MRTKRSMLWATRQAVMMKVFDISVTGDQIAGTPDSPP
jgi:hypothetical protein